MLSQADVTALLDLDRLLDSLEEGFRAVSSGKVEVPGRTAVTAEHDGWLGTMPGYGPGLGLGVKLVSVFPHNDAAGLPSHQALKIFPRVRDFDEIRIASRTIDSARELAALNPKVHAVESFEEAARGADVIAMCTHSSTPVVLREWVAPGTHVTSVGYAAPHGELDRELAEAANLFVESRPAAFSPPPAGCMELAGMDPEKASEMGEVLLGKRPGRRSDDEITVYKSMGHAVEDLAASNLVYKEALARGAGSSVEL